MDIGQGGKDATSAELQSLCLHACEQGPGLIQQLTRVRNHRVEPRRQWVPCHPKRAGGRGVGWLRQVKGRNAPGRLDRAPVLATTDAMAHPTHVCQLRCSGRANNVATH